MSNLHHTKKIRFLNIFLILCAIIGLFKYLIYPACGIDTGDAFSEAYLTGAESSTSELFSITKACVGSLIGITTD